MFMKICTKTFIATLFITVPNWKRPRCLSKGKWWKKLMYPFQGLLPRNEKGLFFFLRAAPVAYGSSQVRG